MSVSEEGKDRIGGKERWRRGKSGEEEEAVFIRGEHT